MFDVLEHIDDDRATLRWLASVLAPGGVLVLTVPAHPFLFDDNDRLAHHRRRYTRRELLDKLREAGLQPVRVEHFMAAMVLPRVLSRLVGFALHKQPDRLSPLSVIPVVNGVAYGLLETRAVAHAVGARALRHVAAGHCRETLSPRPRRPRLTACD